MIISLYVLPGQGIQGRAILELCLSFNGILDDQSSTPRVQAHGLTALQLLLSKVHFLILFDLIFLVSFSLGYQV